MSPALQQVVWPSSAIARPCLQTSGGCDACSGIFRAAGARPASHGTGHAASEIYGPHGDAHLWLGWQRSHLTGFGAKCVRGGCSACGQYGQQGLVLVAVACGLDSHAC